jgi:NAD(P)-dependent dehydrogenase (short-subunit alcohol dehydrogenase family)
VLTKAALDHYTRNAAIEYASKGIRVNTVSPGGTETNFVARHGLPEELWQEMRKNYVEKVIPMRRFASSREVTNVIEFLASDKVRTDYRITSLVEITGFVCDWLDFCRRWRNISRSRTIKTQFGQDDTLNIIT